jgi:hypothetical protein
VRTLSRERPHQPPAGIKCPFAVYLSYSSELATYDLYDSTETTLEVRTGSIASNGESFNTTFVSP